jgi:hypothetical protein
MFIEKGECPLMFIPLISPVSVPRPSFAIKGECPLIFVLIFVCPFPL